MAPKKVLPNMKRFGAPLYASAWADTRTVLVAGGGLHSSSFQLNLSALYGMGVYVRGCVARVKGVLRGV
jgi:hypothetical protein